MEDATVAADADALEAPTRDGAGLPEPDAETGSVPGGSLADPALAAVEALLREEPATFGFFQAVRLLERLRPGREPVGGFADPGDEVVRLGVNPSLAFPPGEIHALELADEGPSSMAVNFMGVIGPQGVLPHEYTRLVGERRREKDPATGDFLDLFHNRILALFYRAWRKHRFELAWEDRRRGGDDEEDRLTAHLLDLVGLGPPAQRRGLGVEDDALARNAAILAPQQRSAVAFEQILEEQFDVPARVEQFVGGWYPLQGRDLCAVGEESASSRLGAGAVVGDEVWDQQARVRIRLGPMARERFEGFLPSGGDHTRLRALTRLFSHDQFEVEVQLVLEREDVPGCVLGDDAAPPQPLGWSTWVRTKGFDRDAGDTILRL